MVSLHVSPMGFRLRVGKSVQVVELLAVKAPNCASPGIDGCARRILFGRGVGLWGRKQRLCRCSSRACASVSTKFQWSKHSKITRLQKPNSDIENKILYRSVKLLMIRVRFMNNSHVQSNCGSSARYTVRTIAHIPVLCSISTSSSDITLPSRPHKTPNPIRPPIPNLIDFLMCTFHKKTTGRKARAKSQKADDARHGKSGSVYFLNDSRTLPPWKMTIRSPIYRGQQLPRMV